MTHVRGYYKELIDMEEQRKESVWVVSAYWELATKPILAIWDNADAAEKNYEYLCEVFGEKRVHLDCLPIGSTFVFGS